LQGSEDGSENESIQNNKNNFQFNDNRLLRIILCQQVQCHAIIFIFILFFVSFEHPGKLETVPVVEYTEKSQEKQESRHVQLVREYGFHPRSKVQVVDGSLLPREFEPFPSHMYGKPLEEIDQFIYEEVSKQVSIFFPIYLIFVSLRGVVWQLWKL
jgi:hypothetical protein